MKKIALCGLMMLGLIASATAQLTLDVPPPDPTTLTGSGSKANAPVELFVNGASVGSVDADASGNFAFTGLNLQVNDQVQAMQAQVWNFNTDGDTEGWGGLTSDTTVVAGGVWTQTEGAGDSQMQISIYGDGLITAGSAVARALHVKLRYTGGAALTGSVLMWSAGPNGVADGGGDDTQSVISNTVTITQTAGFQTLVFDLGIDHTGAPTAWVDGTPAISITLFIPGTNPGDTIEIDSVRLAESLEWNFDNAGEIDEFIPTANTLLTATGGTLIMDAVSTGAEVAMDRPFRLIDSSHFVTMDTRFRQIASSPNLIFWNYFSNPAAFGPGGYQFIGTNADGNYETVQIDLTQPPAFGNAWTLGGGATLNSPGGNAYVGQFANVLPSSTEVDYIRLHPASPTAPSPVRTLLTVPVELATFEIE